MVILQAIPCRGGDPNLLSLLYPVRALHIYLECTQSFRLSEQLFVCFGGLQEGNAASKQRIWIVDVILIAYQAWGIPYLLGVRAHSTKGIASSSGLSNGASQADIKRAAGWATPNTFARFYNLRM